MTKDDIRRQTLVALAEERRDAMRRAEFNRSAFISLTARLAVERERAFTLDELVAEAQQLSATRMVKALTSQREGQSVLLGQLEHDRAEHEEAIARDESASLAIAETLKRYGELT